MCVCAFHAKNVSVNIVQCSLMTIENNKPPSLIFGTYLLFLFIQRKDKKKGFFSKAPHSFSNLTFEGQFLEESD